MTSEENKASLIISFDTELGWGAIENGLWRARQQMGVYRRTRPYVEKLVQLLESLSIPCTWAFVGKMIAGDKLAGEETIAIPNRLIAEALEEAEESTFYGADIFANVQSSVVPHEIAWHTYYHTRYDEREMAEEYAINDLRMAQLIGKHHHTPIRTIVFPQNIGGYYERCGTLGFRYCRTGEGTAPQPLRRRIGRFCASAGLRASTDRVELLAQNFFGTRGSLFFKPPRGRAALLPVVEKMALNGIKTAIKKHGYFHIWIHPFNFAEFDGLLESFASVLRYAAREREHGRLMISTIAEFMDMAVRGKSVDNTADY